MQVFLTDYNSYNNGTQFQFGHWVDLSEFADATELSGYIREHFEEADKKSPLPSGPREEIMITDYEGFPQELYSESMDFDRLFQYRELLEDHGIAPDEEPTDEDWITLHNLYCQKINAEGYIYPNDESFLEIFTKEEIAFKVAYGDWNPHHEYVWLNGYGNFESGDENKVMNEAISQGDIIRNLLA